MPENSKIPSQRVALVDIEKGLITREWFQFFFSLFQLTGSGQNSVTLSDLQMLPPVAPSTGSAGTTVGVVAATLDFPNTAAQTSSDLTITVPGAVDGDEVRLSVPNACMLADTCYNAWVSSPGVVTVRLNNYSAGARNPGSGVFRVAVTRY